MYLHKPDDMWINIFPAIKNRLSYAPVKLKGSRPYKLFYLHDVRNVLKNVREKIKKGADVQKVYRFMTTAFCNEKY